MANYAAHRRRTLQLLSLLTTHPFEVGLPLRRVYSRSGEAVLGTLNLNITDCPEPSPPRQGDPPPAKHVRLPNDWKSLMTV